MTRVDAEIASLEHELAERQERCPRAVRLQGELIAKALGHYRGDRERWALILGAFITLRQEIEPADETIIRAVCGLEVRCISCGHTPADKVQTDPGEGKCLGEAGILPGCPCGVDPGCLEYFEEVGQ